MENFHGMTKIEIEKVHEDERGSIHRILFKGREFIILFTKKGYLRGGDYHKSKQHDVVLTGKMEFRYIKNGEEEVRTLEAGEMIKFEPNVPHMFSAKEDTLIIEWLEGEFEKSYYQPYRRLVLK
jgi:dTDP-4-dehydrorhamnose 3,5-epimerase-like enzyme